MDVTTENKLVEVDPAAGLLHLEAVALLGKTIARVEAHEYSLFLHFTDGTYLCICGHTMDEGPLASDLFPPPAGLE